MANRVDLTSAPPLNGVANSLIKPYRPPAIAEGDAKANASTSSPSRIQPPPAFTLDALPSSGVRRQSAPSVGNPLPAPSARGQSAPVAPASTASSLNLPSHINVAEVHDIAQRSGYVGLTDKAIQRAYQYGASLLTDIRA
jgi:hypothetical protein